MCCKIYYKIHEKAQKYRHRRTKDTVPKEALHFHVYTLWIFRYAYITHSFFSSLLSFFFLHKCAHIMSAKNRSYTSMLWNSAAENENNALSLPHEYFINKRVYIFISHNSEREKIVHKFKSNGTIISLIRQFFAGRSFHLGFMIHVCLYLFSHMAYVLRFRHIAVGCNSISQSSSMVNMAMEKFLFVALVNTVLPHIFLKIPL